MANLKGNMSLKFRKTTVDEIVLIHDFYFLSPEPDAPKARFESLSPQEQNAVFLQYPVESYLSVINENEVIGFMGFFPDDDLNVNIFCVISPENRKKGFFSKILSLSIDYCRHNFSDFLYIRALTRKENCASVEGLKRSSFIRKGEVIEEVQPNVSYEEYIYPIKS